MCRAGGRRCTGTTTSSRATQTARKQRSRAKKALRHATAAGDADAIAAAQLRLDQANAAIAAAKEKHMPHNDNTGTAGQDRDVTPPPPADTPAPHRSSKSPRRRNITNIATGNSRVGIQAGVIYGGQHHHGGSGAGGGGDVTYTFHGPANVNTGSEHQFTQPHQEHRDQRSTSQPWSYETTDEQGRRSQYTFHGPTTVQTGDGAQDNRRPAGIDAADYQQAMEHARRASAQAADLSAQADELIRRHNIPTTPGRGAQIDVVDGRITRINGYPVDHHARPAHGGDVTNIARGGNHGIQVDGPISGDVHFGPDGIWIGGKRVR